MKVTLEIDDKFAKILSITAVGVNSETMDATTELVDLTKYNHITLDENAEWTNGRADNV